MITYRWRPKVLRVNILVTYQLLFHRSSCHPVNDKLIY